MSGGEFKTQLEIVHYVVFSSKFYFVSPNSVIELRMVLL